MARSIWKGSLSFGLVNVPVGLYSATQDKTIHFNQLQRGTSDRVRNKRVNERTGEEVSYEEIVKGYDLGQGQYVVLTDEELEAVEPERSRNIEITDFVLQSEIDPIQYRSTYYLAPEGEGARHAYSLLCRAMSEADQVGVAKMVMRNREYLVAIRPKQNVLAMETMFFADEVRDPSKELPSLPDAQEFSKRELDTAKLLIESMATTFDPEHYRDSYRERLEELIDRKREGEEIVVETPAPKATKVVDLMAALEASVDAARGDGSRQPRRTAKRSGTAKAAKNASAERAPAGKRSPEKGPLKAAAKKTPGAKRASAARRKAS